MSYFVFVGILSVRAMNLLYSQILLLSVYIPNLPSPFWEGPALICLHTSFCTQAQVVLLSHPILKFHSAMKQRELSLASHNYL